MRKGFLVLFALFVSFSAAEAVTVEKVVHTTGVKGGLIVCVGCEDGTYAAALGTDDSFVVQALSENSATVMAAREKVKSAGRYGNVSIKQFDGKHLPYVDSMVNLLIVSDPGNLSNDEVMRVLAPEGFVLVKEGHSIPGLKTSSVSQLDGWKIAQREWPDEIDEWTHYLHDPCGSSVSNDLVAGKPNGLRWTGGPLWARSHEHTASMNAMVSADGRIFYVMDEGRIASIQLPAENYLTARDAFNGVVLWKMPLKSWFNHLYPLKSGPGWLPRRLVAIEDKVYLSPGTGENLLCLDAATGDVLQEYNDTATTFELVVSNGVVFAAVDPDDQPVDYNQQNANCWKERDRASQLFAWKRGAGTRIVKALDSISGDLLWEHELPVVPMTLAVDEEKVCLYDGNAVRAFDRKTGEDLWSTDVSEMKQVLTGYAGPRLIMCENHIVFAPQKQIFVLNPKTGDIIWSAENKPISGHYSLEDVYVIGNRLWVMGRDNRGKFTTYNLLDGEILKEHTNPIDSFYIHQRCYPGKATKKYLLPPIMGNTVYDMQADTWSIAHWVRGGCVYGAMPANGMVYASPHACACYYQSKLNGFNAVAPNAQSAKAPSAEKRLVKGPAYGADMKQTNYSDSQWPVFRHDNTRSGYVKTSIDADIAPGWNQNFSTKLSQPIAADGKVFVSAVDEHTVYALDATSGDEIWHFIAGSRVDSPPTLYNGLALFGCADGWVYALRASDGKLVWKFQAAPSDRQLVSYDQVESVWPISGSVLIEEGKLYCVAGRSMFLDGGLRMLILDPETGKLIAENVMDDKVPGSDKDLQDLMTGKHMPVAMPDILSSDGKYVYMKSQTFTKDGKRVRVEPQRPDTQYGDEVHLFAPISFLDESWHQRTYWLYGRAAGEGWAEFQLPPKRVPYGRILCIDEENAYSYGRDLELLCNTSVSEYRLFSANKEPARRVGIPNLEGSRWPEGRYPTGKENQLAAHTVDWKQLAKQPVSKLTALKYNWIEDEPEILVKAMVLANDLLFVAGPRDVADEKSLWGRSNEEAFQKSMQEQAEWLQGDHGSFLQVVSKKSGETLNTYKVDYLPAFDGLIASEGKLYMTTADGALLCYESK